MATDSTINYANPNIDLTVRIYDQFYDYNANVPAAEYDVVLSFFKSVMGDARIAGNFTANFTNVSTTDSRVLVAALVIIQGSTPYVPTAVQIDGTAQTIKWMSSTSPSGTASKTDIVSFSFIRTGAAWSVLGQYSNYG